MVVLILLIVVTLLGLVALRGSLMEERMSAYMFDRSQAFQSAESALRIAQQEVQAAVVAGRPIGVDCTSSRVTCSATPPGVDSVSRGGCAANTQGCWISVGSKSSYSDQAAGAPQYYIEYMGNVGSSDEDEGANPSASGNAYPPAPSTYSKSIFRISARSHDPRGNRAVVALQATVELR